jgi:glyoxylase-like metal-dependent hydrolase (beta-lactamase superfamily II)
VVAIPTPGHTTHHISVAIFDDTTMFLIAGGVSYTEANFEALLADGVAEDEAVARSTLLRLHALAAKQPIVFLPTHDPQTPLRLARRRTVSSTQDTKQYPAIG